MHRDHEIFVEAIRDKRKVKLTFFSEEDCCSQVKLFAPMDFEQYHTEEESGRYYFWDFEKSANGAPLLLRPDQIISIRLHEETFSPAEFVTWDLDELPWFLGREWGRFS
jgi:hypothetical protein